MVGLELSVANYILSQGYVSLDDLPSITERGYLADNLFNLKCFFRDAVLSLEPRVRSLPISGQQIFYAAVEEIYDKWWVKLDAKWVQIHELWSYVNGEEG